MKLKIEQIKRIPKTSASSGKPYTSLSILSNGVWYSGFGNKDNQAWAPGQEVEVDVVQNGKYWNFTMPKADSNTPINSPILQQILDAVNRIEKKLSNPDEPPAFTDDQIYSMERMA